LHFKALQTIVNFFARIRSIALEKLELANRVDAETVPSRSAEVVTVVNVPFGLRTL
jgi:hypothetical protein